MPPLFRRLFSRSTWPVWHPPPSRPGRLHRHAGRGPDGGQGARPVGDAHRLRPGRARMDIRNKVAIITGRASGIGAGLAERFATEGARGGAEDGGARLRLLRRHRVGCGSADHRGVRALRRHQTCGAGLCGMVARGLRPPRRAGLLPVPAGGAHRHDFGRRRFPCSRWHAEGLREAGPGQVNPGRQPP